MDCWETIVDWSIPLVNEVAMGLRPQYINDAAFEAIGRYNLPPKIH